MFSAFNFYPPFLGAGIRARISRDYRTIDVWMKTFQIAQDVLDDLRARADACEKIEPKFAVDVCDEQGQVVAQVEKLVYIKRRRGA